MKFLIVFMVSLSYAIVRYNVFGPVPIANLPCYVMNKAFALTSVLALCLAAWQAFRVRTQESRNYFAFFKLTLFVHILLSIFLLSPEYYPKMYSAGKMDIYGELHMFFGVLAIAMLMFKSIVREIAAKLEILQPLSLLAVALHLFFLGFAGWPKWREWPGYMVPITLIGFLVALIAFIFQLAKMNANRKT
jgi:uncharacterized membrane protein YhdT